MTLILEFVLGFGDLFKRLNAFQLIKDEANLQLAKLGRNPVLSINIDYLLWSYAVSNAHLMAPHPHHRVRTTAY